MKDDDQKTASELAEEERLAAIARGDIIDDDADDDDTGDDDGDDDTGDDDGDDDDDVGDDNDDDAGDDDAGDDEGDPSDDDDAGDDDDDSDDDDASDSDDDDAGDDEGKGKGKKEGIMIPKARFDEAQKKAKAKADKLQERLDALETGKAQEKTDDDLGTLNTEIEDLEDKWEAELLEGELIKAKGFRKQLNAKRKELFTLQSAQQSQQTGNAAVEQIRFDHQLAAMEAKYPQLNPDHEDVDPVLIEEVNDLMSVYTSAGHTHTSALQKAVHYVIRDDDAKPSKDQKTERSRRGHKARKAVNKASKKSPPNINKAGRDSDKGGKGDGLPDVTKMTPEQFAKLSDKELAKMRGDVLSEQEAA